MNNNNNNNQPRSAVKVTTTTNVKVQNLLKKSDDLLNRLNKVITERKQLQNSKKSNNNNNNNTLLNKVEQSIGQYRMKLCEILSDIILNNITIANEYETIEILWTKCFYDRITEHRKAIAKAEDVSKKKQYTDRLQHFLTEGVTFFQYLCDRMRCKLMDDEDVEEDNEETQESYDNDENENKEEIIPLLNRIYVHLGDLYRYYNNMKYYSKAEMSYYIATQLGPGHGHSYNQLAVICQVKNNSSNDNNSVFTSLYWYIRSLGAIPIPFITSQKNLQRLLNTNRQTIQKHNNKKTTTSTESNVTLVGTTSRDFLISFTDLFYILLFNNDSNNNNIIDETQYYYNQLTENVTIFTKLLNNSAFGDTLLCKLITILSFTEYYNNKNYYNDNKKNTKISKNLVIASKITTYELSNCIAERVITILNNKLKSITKNNNNNKNNTNNNNTSLPSVRVLLPLLLIAEYLITESDDNNNNIIDEYQNNNNNSIEKERYKDAINTFWKSIVIVYNTLQSFILPVGNNNYNIDISSNNSTKQQLKEYQNLLGFAPFQSFIDTTDLTETGYLNEIAAKELFHTLTVDNEEQNVETAVTNKGQSQTTATSGSTTTNTTKKNTTDKISQEESTRIKIQRFLGLKIKLVTTNNIPICEKDDGTLEWMENNVERNEMNDDGGGDGFFPTIASSDDDEYENKNDRMDVDSPQRRQQQNDDLLTYRQDTTGGPALLVPGAFLQNRATENVLNDMVATTTTTKAPMLAATTATTNSTINTLPPPGMSFPSQPVQQQQQQQHATTSTLFPSPENQPNNNIMSSRRPVMPPPGFGQQPITTATSTTTTALDPPIGFPQPSSQQQLSSMMLSSSSSNNIRIPTLGETYDLFGGPSALQTANPFANVVVDTTSIPTVDDNNHHLLFGNSTEQQPQQPYIGSGLFGNNNDMMDGNSLLDSSLLNSILADDNSGHGTSNKNPFATKNPFAM